MAHTPATDDNPISVIGTKPQASCHLWVAWGPTLGGHLQQQGPPGRPQGVALAGGLLGTAPLAPGSQLGSCVSDGCPVIGSAPMVGWRCWLAWLGLCQV